MSFLRFSRSNGKLFSKGVLLRIREANRRAVLLIKYTAKYAELVTPGLIQIIPYAETDQVSPANSNLALQENQGA